MEKLWGWEEWEGLLFIKKKKLIIWYSFFFLDHIYLKNNDLSLL